MNTFYTILTDAGMSAITSARANESEIKLSKMAVGDGAITPSQDMTSLISEKYRFDISSITQDKYNPNHLIVEGVIPSDIGGFNISEVAIFTEDEILFAIGNLPKTYKPQLEEGSAKELTIQVITEVTNANSVTLNIDDNSDLVTKDFLADELEKYALLNGDENNSFKVANAVNENEAVNKKQLDSKVDNLTSVISNKVDEVDGKGLSTNDFTDTEKALIDVGTALNTSQTTFPTAINFLYDSSIDFNNRIEYLQGRLNDNETNTINELNKKQNTLVSGANIKTINNNSLLGSGNINIDIDLSSKQDVLVSGNNIKTINGESILGEGNIEIVGKIDSGKETIADTRTFTVGANGDYPDLYDALDDISSKYDTKKDIFNNAINLNTVIYPKIEIRILSGTTLFKRIALRDIDLSNIYIYAEDPNVYVDIPKTQTIFFSAFNSKLPILGCVFDGRKNDIQGLSLVNSTMYVGACRTGFQNFSGNELIDGSRIERVNFRHKGTLANAYSLVLKAQIDTPINKDIVVTYGTTETLTIPAGVTESSSKTLNSWVTDRVYNINNAEITNDTEYRTLSFDSTVTVNDQFDNITNTPSSPNVRDNPIKADIVVSLVGSLSASKNMKPEVFILGQTINVISTAPRFLGISTGSTVNVRNLDISTIDTKQAYIETGSVLKVSSKMHVRNTVVNLAGGSFIQAKELNTWQLKTFPNTSFNVKGTAFIEKRQETWIP